MVLAQFSGLSLPNSHPVVKATRCLRRRVWVASQRILPHLSPWVDSVLSSVVDAFRSDLCCGFLLLPCPLDVHVEDAAGMGSDLSVTPNPGPSSLVAEHEQLTEAVMTLLALSRGHRRRQLPIPSPFLKLAYKPISSVCSEVDPRLFLPAPVHLQTALLKGGRDAGERRRGAELPGVTTPSLGCSVRSPLRRPVRS